VSPPAPLDAPDLGAPDLGANHLLTSRASNRQHEHAIAELRPDQVAGDDDLQRLECSVKWLKRECMIVALEDGLRTLKQRLPRANRLPRVSGIPPVETEIALRKRGTLFQVAPPRAFERLQSTKRKRAFGLRGVLCILIASLIAGSIAYQIYVGESFSASQPAQADSLQAR
jgi:hypothetical protein